MKIIRYFVTILTLTALSSLQGDCATIFTQNNFSRAQKNYQSDCQQKCDSISGPSSFKRDCKNCCNDLE